VEVTEDNLAFTQTRILFLDRLFDLDYQIAAPVNLVRGFNNLPASGPELLVGET